MTKGTTSFGRKTNRNHRLCPRCGRPSFHIQKVRCAQCGFPDAKTRKYAWAYKAVRHNGPYYGRATHLKEVASAKKSGVLKQEYKKYLKAAAAPKK